MTEVNPAVPALEECVALLGRLTAKVLLPDDSVWCGLGMTMGELKALLRLTHRGPQSVGALSRALGIAESSASLLVDKLEERGLVAREVDEGDRRRTLVVPTTTAIELADQLRRVRQERLRELLTSLTQDELDALTVGARALLAAYGALVPDGACAEVRHG